MWSRVPLDTTGVIPYFQMMIKWKKFTTFSTQFLCYSLSLDKKILHQRISFRVRTTDIDNKYDIYSRTCADGSSIIEGADFIVSYAPVSGVISLCIIISIASKERLIISILDIYNAFQNNILPNPEERVYLSLPSDILLTGRLVSTSIPHHSQNITNFFSKTCSIDPLAITHHQMINTAINIRRESCDVYNMLHPDCTGKLWMEILLMTTYTLINYKEKDRAVIKIFHTAMYNSMHAYP